MKHYTYWDHATDDNKLRHLHAAELSDYRIAEIMDFSYGCIREHRRRLKLPSHRPTQFVLPERDGPLPNSRPDPLAIAQSTLRGFDRENMTLNGKPVKLLVVMQLTNSGRKAKGQEQILYNEAWRAPE